MIKSKYNSFYTTRHSSDNSRSWNDLLSNKKAPQEVVINIIAESHFVSPDLSIVFENIRV